MAKQVDWTKTFVKNARKVKELEEENAKLKKILEHMFEKVRKLEKRLVDNDLPVGTDLH